MPEKTNMIYMVLQPGAKIPTPQTLSEAPLEKPSGAKASPKTGEDTSVTVQDESFNPAPCQECYCGPKRNPTTKLNIITCTPVVCNTSCAEVRRFIQTSLRILLHTLL
ncbi:hypothetical protein ILYODFUR_037511 [Ilyodon furcidens]|uniref:Uncharacterized protein n=1 Tax=Ilyodon furcidens TaxID=33524 RepID=A0ABV0TEB2_9TELE